MKNENLNIIYLDWKNEEHVNAVSLLHMKLLPESILSKLGLEFLCKFYYSKLCKENLIEVYLYKMNQNFVGFISCTNKPFSFTKEGERKYKFTIYRLLIKSIFFKPTNFVTLLKQTKDLALIDFRVKGNEKMGQFLSFGVLEKYRKHIDEIDQCSVPNVLMKMVFTHFKKNNSNFFLQVLKSNISAIKFYDKYNGMVFKTDVISKSNIVVFNVKD